MAWCKWGMEEEAALQQLIRAAVVANSTARVQRTAKKM